MRSALLALLLACDPPPAQEAGPAEVEAAAPAEEQGPWLEEEGDAAHPEERIAARHILVSWKGALRNRLVKRSPEEALALARELRARLEAGEDFAALAMQYSDDRGSGKRGGALGAFGRGVMQKEFEAAAFALPEGGLSEPVESPFGYHIIERQPLVEARLAEILIRWEPKGEGAAPRDAEETRALAQTALARLEAGEPFAAVARDLSEGAAGPWGGDLGWFQQGQLSPELDRPAFALEPGQRTGVLETRLGLHIVERLE